MRFDLNPDLISLRARLPDFFELVGGQRWFERANQLAIEMDASPFRWKIVRDYHWLEMAISHQAEILYQKEAPAADPTDTSMLAAMRFAAMVVEMHRALPEQGRRVLEGRLADDLNAETGFAALYLEMEQAVRLMDDGYDVVFPDMQGTGQYDLEFSRGNFVGEVECKSISADAGRMILRKDFYRFIEDMSSAMAKHSATGRTEVFVVTLAGRFSANLDDQAPLREAMRMLIASRNPTPVHTASFDLERTDFANVFAGINRDDPEAVRKRCAEAYGLLAHVAGNVTVPGGWLVVMRSRKEDDTSKPLLKAMRKAVGQLSGKRPSFIAVQFQDIEPADLMLPHLRRRMGILSYALFGHYGASHVNATAFTGFGAVVAHERGIGTPSFAIPNLQPAFPIEPDDMPPFLRHLPDADFAAAIGAPLPAPNISYVSFD